MQLAGTDEAGRGPLIGPLVICGATIEEEKQNTLKTLGVKDSKLLTPKQREKLFEILPQHVKYHLIIIQPPEIDAAVLSKTTNLNWLEADKTAEILLNLKPDKTIVDCPSPNTMAYQKYILQKIALQGFVTTVSAEHKADLNHPIVGAASIFAKVTRDREIEKLKKDIGEDFGSGYPSDPKTKKFLKKHWETHAYLFRKSWKTYQSVASQAE